MAKDAVATALAAVEDPAPAPRATIKVNLATGREVLVNVPVDLGTIELISLIGYLTSPTFVETLGRARAGAATSPLLVPARQIVRA